MGTDKAALRLGGATLVERVAAALRSITSDVHVVSSKHDAARWGLPVVHDVYENSGALGGLQAALAHANTERRAGERRIAVVSCDLPFVTGALLKRLASFCAAEWDAVAPVQEDGRAQPLCAIYESGRCGPVADLLLGSGELRPRELLARVRTRWVAFEELRDLDGAGLFFMNVNTPDEYEKAREVTGG